MLTYLLLTQLKRVMTTCLDAFDCCNVVPYHLPRLNGLVKDSPGRGRRGFRRQVRAVLWEGAESTQAADGVCLTMKATPEHCLDVVKVFRTDAVSVSQNMAERCRSTCQQTGTIVTSSV